MSKLTLIEDTTATLVGGPATSLFSILISNTEPPAAITVDFHDCTATGDLAAGNKKASVTLSAQATNVSHIFDGALFVKGLVVKSDTACTITIESE